VLINWYLSVNLPAPELLLLTLIFNHYYTNAIFLFDLFSCNCILTFRCNITLSSWALDNRYLLLQFDGSESFRFSTNSESNEWLLVDSSATINLERYPYGENDILELELGLEFRVRVRLRINYG